MNMQNQFRFPDLFENLRMEFDRLNNEYSVCKRQRDEFEKLLQNQIMEAKNMESTINDLKNKQIMAKRQYYEEINMLKEKYGVVENPGEERISQSAKRLRETATSSVSNPNKQVKYQMPMIGEEGGNLESPPNQSGSPNRRSSDNSLPMLSHGDNIINQINGPSSQMYGQQMKNPQMGMQMKNPSMPGSQPYQQGYQHMPTYQQQPQYGSQKGMGGQQLGKHMNVMGKPPTKQVYAPPPQQKFQGSYHNIQVVPNQQMYSNQVPVHSIQQIPQQMNQQMPQKQLYAKKPIVNSPVKYPVNPSVGGGGGYPQMPPTKAPVEKVVKKSGPAKNPKVPVLQMVKVQNPKNGDWQIKKNSLVESPLNVDLLHNLNHDSVVCCVKFSGDGRYLATGCNKRAFIYDTDTGEVAHTLYDQNAHEKTDLYIRSVCFSPNGKHIATGAEDKTVKVWDIETKTNITFPGHTHDIYSLDYSPDGKIIASGSGDKKVKVWNVEENKCCYTFGDDELGPKDGVTSVAISPDGRLVAAGSLDKIVRIWDLSTGFFLERYEGHEDSVYSVSFSPDGKTLVSGSLDKTLKIWDLAGGRSRAKCVSSFEGHSDYVLSVAFSKDGRWIVSGSKDRNIIFWDPRTTLPHLMLQGHRNSVISVDVSPVSKLFASGSGDFRARLWNFT